jgi:hypothetical protein
VGVRLYSLGYFGENLVIFVLKSEKVCWAKLGTLRFPILPTAILPENNGLNSAKM